ncbi:MAG: hypothetical protein WC438_00800 [Candidatus Pacearchaeota archaeon]
MVEKIRALFIFEALGRPPEHVQETLNQLVDRIGQLPGIKIESKKVHEAKPIEKTENKEVQDLWTSFCETELIADTINDLMLVMFNAMPSHVEVIEPDELRIKNSDISNLCSDLVMKLHKYDEIAKGIMIERNIMNKKFKEMEDKLKNFESEVKEDKPEKKTKKKKK